MTRRVRIEKLFFVDDSDDEFFITKLLFQRQNIGLEIEHFHNFASYRERLESFAPDELMASISALDLNLGVSKGTDGIADLRAQPIGRDLLVGICSGSEDPADVLSAHRVGANFFVSKPLDAKCLATICEIVSILEFSDEDDTVVLDRVLPPDYSE